MIRLHRSKMGMVFSGYCFRATVQVDVQTTGVPNGDILPRQTRYFFQYLRGVTRYRSRAIVTRAVAALLTEVTCSERRGFKPPVLKSPDRRSSEPVASFIRRSGAPLSRP